MSSLTNLNLGKNIKLSSVNSNVTGNSAGIGINGSGDSGNGRTSNVGVDGVNFNDLLNNGFWDALNNNPILRSGIGTDGDYYTVSNAGKTTLDGINVWNLDDIVIFNNGSWKRVDSRGFNINNLNTTSTDVRFKHDSYGIYINDGNFNRTYVSDFYNEYNVSDSDINNALNILNELYEQQKIEIRNILSDQDNLSLKDSWLDRSKRRSSVGTPDERALLLYREFPSDVYFGKSITDDVTSILKPSLSGNSNDVFNGGKIDDFFIDTENKVIYGPKESNISWGEPIKY